MPRWMYGLLVIALGWMLWTKWIKPTPDISQITTQQGVQVVALENYEGSFRVLSREDYHLGREAEFSPMDIAVGWGEMANPQVYKQIDISQSNRWYRWSVDHEPPIPLRQIATHSANMHLVPANATIAAQMKKIEQDDLVYLKGSLIEIQAQDGWRWKSSLSREDTGNGACELMRVDQIIWQ
ncbi:hypothetical protein [Acinetobacter proteolyticus]|uniref:hypothetical protein n=1 Tax=Acinetobacter proteolyticus TaxID=1776741 RepID=UPI003D9543A2